MSSTNSVVGGGGGAHAALPSIRAANSARTMGLRSSSVVASARSELNGRRTNFKSAAFDDWFKTAFAATDGGGGDGGPGGGTGRSPVSGRGRQRGDTGRHRGRAAKGKVAGGGGAGTQASASKRLSSINAKALLAEKQALLKVTTTRSKAIPSLKNGRPRFAADTTSSRADAATAAAAAGSSGRTSPEAKLRKKREAEAARKRAALAAKSKLRLKGGMLAPLDTSGGGGVAGGGSTPSLFECAGAFCKHEGRRDAGEALILKPIRRRAVVEYRMFLERRGAMTGREARTANDFVSVCQKCHAQYRKLEKLKGWDNQGRVTFDGDGTPLDPSRHPRRGADAGGHGVHNPKGGSYRTMRPDVLNLKRRDHHRRRKLQGQQQDQEVQESQQLAGQQAELRQHLQLLDGPVSDAALRSHHRLMQQQQKVGAVGPRGRAADHFVGYNYRDGKRHRWRKRAPTLRPRNNNGSGRRGGNGDHDDSEDDRGSSGSDCGGSEEDTEGEEDGGDGGGVGSSRRHRGTMARGEGKGDDLSSRRATAQAMARQHGRQLFSPTRTAAAAAAGGSSRKQRKQGKRGRRQSGRRRRGARREGGSSDDDATVAVSPARPMGCELCDCQCYRPNNFLLNRCDTCAHAKKLHTVDRGTVVAAAGVAAAGAGPGGDPALHDADATSSPLLLLGNGGGDDQTVDDALERSRLAIQHRIAMLEQEEQAREATRQEERRAARDARLLAEAEAQLAAEEEAEERHREEEAAATVVRERDEAEAAAARGAGGDGGPAATHRQLDHIRAQQQAVALAQLHMERARHAEATVDRHTREAAADDDYSASADDGADGGANDDTVGDDRRWAERAGGQPAPKPLRQHVPAPWVESLYDGQQQQAARAVAAAGEQLGIGARGRVGFGRSSSEDDGSDDDDDDDHGRTGSDDEWEGSAPPVPQAAVVAHGTAVSHPVRPPQRPASAGAAHPSSPSPSPSTTAAAGRQEQQQQHHHHHHHHHHGPRPQTDGSSPKGGSAPSAAEQWRAEVGQFLGGERRRH